MFLSNAAGCALHGQVKGVSGRMVLLRCGGALSPLRSLAAFRRPSHTSLRGPPTAAPGAAQCFHLRGLAVASKSSTNSSSERTGTIATKAPAGDSNGDGGAAVNRWKYLPVCFVSGLPFGAYYSWSVFQGALTKHVGVLAQASTDWDLSQTLPVFTVNGVMLATGAILMGTWIDKVGARKALRLGAGVWTTGMLTAAMGAHLHEIGLVYAGVGVIGGLGLSLG